jgi:putative peptidoglycan lipid II flippase
MIRDMATAALLGMSGGGVMDAFAIAFRIPNLFRRLFGEGALAASYVPVLCAELDRNRDAAWQLATVTLTWVSVVLVVVVAAGEVICGIAWRVCGDSPGATLLVGLTAVMLPYLLFVCLAAQLAATLHCLGHFAAPALAPTLLNLCWLFAVWVVAPRFAPDKEAQVFVLAVAVAVAGPLQVGLQLWVLRKLGFRFDYMWSTAKSGLGKIVRAMGPMLLGLTVTQINTMADSLLAWFLAAVPGGPEHIDWLPGRVRYPMQQGAAAAIYYGERLYQFPMGILGLAVATAIFPLLSRHAARGQREKLAEDLTLGLRLVIFLAVPAGIGLILLAEPLTRLLFERGEFTAQDTARASRMIACYSAGVWAYCALPVVVRGYYALLDRSTPVRIGLFVVALNLAMNLLLVWPLAEAGLAVATATAASVQVLVLLCMFSRAKGPLGWSALGATTARTLAATLAMAGAGYAALRAIPPTQSTAIQLVRVIVPLLVAVVVYFAVYRVCGGREIRLLFGGLDTGRRPEEGAFSDDLDG